MKNLPYTCIFPSLVLFKNSLFLFPNSVCVSLFLFLWLSMCVYLCDNVKVCLSNAVLWTVCPFFRRPLPIEHLSSHASLVSNLLAFPLQPEVENIGSFDQLLLSNNVLWIHICTMNLVLFIIILTFHSIKCMLKWQILNMGDWFLISFAWFCWFCSLLSVLFCAT